MNFLLNKSDKKEIEKLIETRYYNNEIADFINENVINNPINNDAIKEYNVKELNMIEYTNNSYYKNIRINECEKDNYQIKYESILSNNCFLYDEAIIDKNDYYLIKNQIGYFPKDYKFLSIQKNDVTWMSVIPHEINTMKNIIDKANGNVYVLGLGLGYFPYQISSKDNVSSITIVDNDPVLVDLFKNNIFPTFINQNKYKFIIDDAFNYLKNINKNEFIFIDLWHNEVDGLLTYIKLKKQLKDYTNVHYWIEKSLLNAFRNLLIILIEEEFYKVDQDYKTAKDDNELIINKLHDYLINKTFNSYNEIKDFLDDSNLKSLIIKLDI